MIQVRTGMGLSVKIKIKICLLGQWRFTEIQNEKEFRSQSIKTQCIMFGLYWTLYEIESAI